MVPASPTMDRRRAHFPSFTEFPDSPSVYSHAYHSPNDNETVATDDVQDDSDDSDCTDDASHRISLQGPKIKFHSRAPWEMDDTNPEQSINSPRSATFGSRLMSKASRADTLIRTFTRGSSTTSRPSVDSTRSQASATSSFEITAGSYSSSRGALYDLATQSMSTSSLASSATSASIRSRNFARLANYPKPSHYTPQTIHDSSSRTTVSLDGMVSPSTVLESVPMHSRERSGKLSRQSHDDFVHPYANPDLVASYTPSPETIPSHLPISGTMGASDSNGTVTDSASTRSAPFSVISTDASSTSLTSQDVPHGNLRVNGKEISSPVSVFHQVDTSYVDRSTKFLSLHPPPAGFEDPRCNIPRSPTVALISLQEAQARERFRINTVHPTVTRPDDIPEVAEEQFEETDTVGENIYTRARSTSSGARHVAPRPPAQPQDAEMKGDFRVSTSPKALKHKKSGFMRLFGGRNSEGDKERNPPLPIPSPTTVYAEESSRIHGAGKAAKLTPSKASKSSFQLPSHVSGVGDSSLVSIHDTSCGGEPPDGKGLSARRRQLPPLSIVTKTPEYSVSSLVAAQSSPAGLNFTSPALTLSVPQSAPPGHSDFSGLKLRPVSTSFSSHFADMVAGTAGESQRDVHTPSSVASSNTALSPFTPVSTRRSDDASATAVEVSGEEFLTIKGLQDQFIYAQKAWQQQIWELRGQVRDLTSELEDLRAVDNQEFCEVCGRGEPRKRHALPLGEQPKKVGVVNRPRARTGDTARFASGN